MCKIFTDSSQEKLDKLNKLKGKKKGVHDFFTSNRQQKNTTTTHSMR